MDEVDIVSSIDGTTITVSREVANDPAQLKVLLDEKRRQNAQANQITDLPIDTPLPANAEYASGSAPVMTSGQPNLGQTMTGSRNASMRDTMFSTPQARINPADTRDATAFEAGFNYSMMNPVVGGGQRIRETLDRFNLP